MEENKQRTFDPKILNTPREKYKLGIGEFSYGPCTYLGPFKMVKTGNNWRGHHDQSYGLRASISFQIGYSFDLGIDATAARKMAFKKVRKLLKNALKTLNEAAKKH